MIIQVTKYEKILDANDPVQVKEHLPTMYDYLNSGENDNAVKCIVLYNDPDTLLKRLGKEQKIKYISSYLDISMSDVEEYISLKEAEHERIYDEYRTLYNEASPFEHMYQAISEKLIHISRQIRELDIDVNNKKDDKGFDRFVSFAEKSAKISDSLESLRQARRSSSEKEIDNVVSTSKKKNDKLTSYIEQRKSE